MPNNGAILNLPQSAIVEAPTLVDRAGLQFTAVGELPPQIVGYVQPHVTQHELFIRAAMEGRRDHVYQAAMFDPLTAATLSTDKIVEMCDELIAGHGDLLPALDAKKTLVPASGKSFKAVDPKELRKSWDAAQEKECRQYVGEWQIIGPFTSAEPEKFSLEFRTQLEEEFAKRADGGVDLAGSYRAGEKGLKWKPVKAGKRGLVNLQQEIGAVEFCVAYAYAEVQEVHGRETILSCGSDDGIKVWLNGKLVHCHDAHRGYNPNCDTAPICLKPGVNRILVKVNNYRAGWGFGLGIPRANF